MRLSFVPPFPPMLAEGVESIPCWTLLAVIAGSFVVSCGSKTIQVHESAVADPTHAEHIQPIWDANCTRSGCHTTSDGAGGLALEIDVYLQVVDFPSDDTGLVRIALGDPEASYLWHKLLGTHRDVGGTGASMPSGGDPLFDADLDTIENWIVNGAPE